MASVVADTHAVLWALLQPQKLSARALAVFNHVKLSGDPVYVASITLVETCYLEEKGKLKAGTLARLKAAFEGEDSGLVLVSLDLAITEALERVLRNEVPDMPDRIIAATALHLNLPLVTRDGKIRATRIHTIW
jgi:PIN domain nuclease of toxin-antitoxin system